MILFGILLVVTTLVAVLLVLLYASSTPEPPAVDLAAWQRELRALSRDEPPARFDGEGGLR